MKEDNGIFVSTIRENGVAAEVLIFMSLGFPCKNYNFSLLKIIQNHV